MIFRTFHNDNVYKLRYYLSRNCFRNEIRVHNCCNKSYIYLLEITGCFHLLYFNSFHVIHRIHRWFANFFIIRRPFTVDSLRFCWKFAGFVRKCARIDYKEQTENKKSQKLLIYNAFFSNFFHFFRFFCLTSLFICGNMVL